MDADEIKRKIAETEERARSKMPQQEAMTKGGGPRSTSRLESNTRRSRGRGVPDAGTVVTHGARDKLIPITINLTSDEWTALVEDANEQPDRTNRNPVKIGHAAIRAYLIRAGRIDRSGKRLSKK